MATQWLKIRLTSRSSCGTALLIIVFIASSSRCLGEWTKTINCSSAQVYRDVQQDAGREEFCERSLPGSLVVKDGPYRSWFSSGALCLDLCQSDTKKPECLQQVGVVCGKLLRRRVLERERLKDRPVFECLPKSRSIKDACKALRVGLS